MQWEMTLLTLPRNTQALVESVDELNIHNQVQEEEFLSAEHAVT